MRPAAADHRGRRARVVRANLRRELTSFIGHQRAVQKLRQLLRDAPLLTLHTH